MPLSQDRAKLQPAGQAWLRRELNLQAPLPATESYIVAGRRRTDVSGLRTFAFYPKESAPDDAILSHIRFALRNEPIGLGVLVATLKSVKAGDVETWVRDHPKGSVSRRIWFFYERFTGRSLSLDDARGGNYVEALNPVRHVVTKGQNSKRHRVSDNLLGGPFLCPTLRRAARLGAAVRQQSDKQARMLMRIVPKTSSFERSTACTPRRLRSTCTIEGEAPSVARARRFVAVLSEASEFDPTDKAALVGLQGALVDSRYAASGRRSFQNYVGSTNYDFMEDISRICPRPEDVPNLVDGWSFPFHRVTKDVDDPVSAAAVAALAFVLIHPFEDGNGRIHRFLIHQLLASRHYSPAGVILPVSAAILRDRKQY